MLTELATVGIELRPGVGVDQLTATHARVGIEKGAFEMLFAVMGDEQLDPKMFEVLEPLSDDVWHFDTEAIEDHGAYVRFVENCRRLQPEQIKAINRATGLHFKADLNI